MLLVAGASSCSQHSTSVGLRYLAFTLEELADASLWMPATGSAEDRSCRAVILPPAPADNQAYYSNKSDTQEQHMDKMCIRCRACILD